MTDLRPKQASREVRIAGGQHRCGGVGGIAGDVAGDVVAAAAAADAGGAAGGRGRMGGAIRKRDNMPTRERHRAGWPTGWRRTLWKTTRTDDGTGCADEPKKGTDGRDVPGGCDDQERSDLQGPCLCGVGGQPVMSESASLTGGRPGGGLRAWRRKMGGFVYERGKRLQTGMKWEKGEENGRKKDEGIVRSLYPFFYSRFLFLPFFHFGEKRRRGFREGKV